MELAISRIDNSTTVVVPKELLTCLRLGKGEKLYLIEKEEGYKLIPYKEEFANFL